jgi:hypothetical protein
MHAIRMKTYNEKTTSSFVLPHHRLLVKCTLIYDYNFLHVGFEIISYYYNALIVATPLWVKWEDETPTPKVGDLESPGLPNV